MRDSATKFVMEIIKRDSNVLALTADNRNEIYDVIRQEYPSQYIEYGIAEENMIASAAGLASCGKIPFIYTITNFMSMHAYEFIRNDVCIPNMNVKFLGRSSGLASSSMGPTHQGTEELALLRTLPNMIAITPASPIEAREATRFAYCHKGPVYIRLEARGERELFEENYSFELGKGQVIHEGDDICVISMGSIIGEALKATEILKTEGISLRVINMPSIKPIDAEIILKAARETKHIITYEEHSIFGGLGTSVAEVIAINGISCKFAMMGLNCCAKSCGNRQDMREINHISMNDLILKVRSMIQ